MLFSTSADTCRRDIVPGSTGVLAFNITSQGKLSLVSPASAGVLPPPSRVVSTANNSVFPSRNPSMSLILTRKSLAVLHEEHSQCTNSLLSWIQPGSSHSSTRETSGEPSPATSYSSSFPPAESYAELLYVKCFAEVAHDHRDRFTVFERLVDVSQQGSQRRDRRASSLNPMLCRGQDYLLLQVVDRIVSSL